MSEQQRTERTAVEQAVYDTLAEYNHRAHGLTAVPEPTWFLDWLRERGYEVTPTGARDESLSEWLENSRVAEVLAALVRRGGSEAAEFTDSELHGFDATQQQVQFRQDDDGNVRVEITEVSE